MLSIRNSGLRRFATATAPGKKGMLLERKLCVHGLLSALRVKRCRPWPAALLHLFFYRFVEQYTILWRGLGDKLLKDEKIAHNSKNIQEQLTQ